MKALHIGAAPFFMGAEKRCFAHSVENHTIHPARLAAGAAIL
jgi:hypothetical protein